MINKYTEIDEVIAYIHKHIDEPLPLAKLAQYAAYSPYHFSRMFKKRIGISPHYFIASLRLQKAKDLLLNTNLTVRDIGMEIGQQSLGTFTTRFTERVGMTPSQFRKSPREIKPYLQSLQELRDWHTLPKIENNFNKVQGTVEAEVPFRGVILIGLFNKPIPEGLPQYGTLLSSMGEFSFTNVDSGTYYLMATAVSWDMQVQDILVPQTTLRVRAKSPIIVNPMTTVPNQKLILHRPRLDDPPILTSLPLLMNNFLNRNAR